MGVPHQAATCECRLHRLPSNATSAFHLSGWRRRNVRGCQCSSESFLYFLDFKKKFYQQTNWEFHKKLCK